MKLEVKAASKGHQAEGDHLAEQEAVEQEAGVAEKSAPSVPHEKPLTREKGRKNPEAPPLAPVDLGVLAKKDNPGAAPPPPSKESVRERLAAALRGELTRSMSLKKEEPAASARPATSSPAAPTTRPTAKPAAPATGAPAGTPTPTLPAKPAVTPVAPSPVAPAAKPTAPPIAPSPVAPAAKPAAPPIAPSPAAPVAKPAATPMAPSPGTPRAKPAATPTASSPPAPAATRTATPIAPPTAGSVAKPTATPIAPATPAFPATPTAKPAVAPAAPAPSKQTAALPTEQTLVASHQQTVAPTKERARADEATKSKVASPSPPPEMETDDASTASAAKPSEPAGAASPPKRPMQVRFTGMKPMHVVEAALFSAGKPVSVEEIAATTGLPPDSVRQGIKDLQKDYAARDTVLEVGKAGAKWGMQVKQVAAEPAAKFAPMEIAPKLLKTLALIAYHQPLKQSELVDMIGTKVYDHVPELVERGLVRSREEGVTKILTTTAAFPEYFGLDAAGPEEVRKVMGKLVGIEAPPKKTAQETAASNEAAKAEAGGQPSPDAAASAPSPADGPAPAQ